MTGFTGKAIPYMQAADPLAQVAAQIQATAQKVDDLLPVAGNTTISGTAVAAGGLLSATINFGFTWATAPTSVVCYINGFVSSSSQIIVKGTATVTTTSFSLSVVNTASAAATWTNLPIRWVAIP